MRLASTIMPSPPSDHLQAASVRRHPHSSCLFSPSYFQSLSPLFPSNFYTQHLHLDHSSIVHGTHIAQADNSTFSTLPIVFLPFSLFHCSTRPQATLFLYKSNPCRTINVTPTNNSWKNVLFISTGSTSVSVPSPSQPGPRPRSLSHYSFLFCSCPVAYRCA